MHTAAYIFCALILQLPDYFCMCSKIVVILIWRFGDNLEDYQIKCSIFDRC